MSSPIYNTPSSLTETPQINGHDSPADHPPPPPHQAADAVSGDKRKRDDEGADTEKKQQHPLWKTSLCSFFRRQDASCGHGAACRYAHTEAELRQRPDKTWDPTSSQAKNAAAAAKKNKSEEEEMGIDDVMMTEALEDDDDEDGEEGGFGSDLGLSKCLVHLPRNWKSDKLNDFLSDQGIKYKSAKKKKGMALGFVSFENAERLGTAVKALDGISIGNNNVKVADVLPRSFEKKTKSALGLPLIGENGEDSLENGVEDGDGIKGRTARTVVTPLSHFSYDDQLEQKKSSVAQILKKLTRNARKACPNGVPLPEWILKSREIGGLPCILEGILPSPVVNGYRNKCEFSVGHSLQGKVTVGFMLGNFREGVTAVEEPLDCPNVSAISCMYASIFQEFLQQSSLPVWNRFNNTGFWRQLTVREGRSGVAVAENCESNIAELLLMVQVSTAGFDDSLVTSEFERLAQVFSTGASENSPSLPLTALVIQDHRGISNVAPADAPLRTLCISKEDEIQATNNMTEPKIHDYINNLRFCISPTAFFQVNTLAAEKLYSLAGDWAELGPDTLLFDVCCGTGTIGLTLAHRVGMVVGIEMNASAVLDAKRNAEINGIKNCRFVCSKAEDVMRSLLEEYVTSPEKVTDAMEGSDEAIVAEEKKIVATYEGNAMRKDEKLNSEDSAIHGSENGKTASASLENGLQELQQSSSSVKNGSSVRCFKSIVAIVDPPRNGLHPTVIKALRTHSGLRRLVYISCNPETLVANAIELCTPSSDKIEKGKNNRAWRNMSSAGLARHRAKSMPASEPFRPVKAMAVDLFPHTVHCELVMLLER